VELCFLDDAVDQKINKRKCSFETFKIFDTILTAAKPLTSSDIAIRNGMDAKTVLKILRSDQTAKLPFFEKNKIIGGKSKYHWSISQYGFNYIQNCQLNPYIDINELQRKAQHMVATEHDFHEKLKREKDMLVNKTGIDKFFTPDLANPIDREILIRLRSKYKKYPTGEERRVRIILAKRIKGKGISLGREKEKTDTTIKNRIEIMCLRQNRLWNDIVREMFVVEFNLKPLLR
jgi:hypothetical protein